MPDEYKLFRYSCQNVWFRDPTELTDKELATKAEAIEVALGLGERLWANKEALDKFEHSIVLNQLSELRRFQQLINDFLVNPLAFF